MKDFNTDHLLVFVTENLNIPQMHFFQSECLNWICVRLAQPTFLVTRIQFNWLLDCEAVQQSIKQWVYSAVTLGTPIPLEEINWAMGDHEKWLFA